MRKFCVDAEVSLWPLVKIALIAALGSAIARVAFAAEVTIFATAHGSPTPALGPNDQYLTNGDFLIWPNLLAPVTGDGIDEVTSWTFDFTNDPSFASFPQDGILTGALLTLTLTTPFSPGPPTDYVQIGSAGLPLVPMPLFLNASTGTIEFELLDYMCASAVLEQVNYFSFKLPMYYAEDAVVSHAQLALTARPACPGNTDGDDDVDLSDLGVILANYGGPGGCVNQGDLDGDGDVDLSDLGIVLAAFGSVCL